MRSDLLLLLLLAPLMRSHATVWQVGAGFTYTLPSQVSNLVQNGDTVDITVGTYPSDVARWAADDLVLRGVGGFAVLESNGMAWGDKAIWVIQGNRTTVEWIEFSECSVPDQNGAGIRQEGADLIAVNANLNQGLPLVAPRLVPVLDATFRPAVLANHAFRAAVKSSGQAQPLRLALEQADGSVFHYATEIFTEDATGRAAF